MKEEEEGESESENSEGLDQLKARACVYKLLVRRVRT